MHLGFNAGSQVRYWTRALRNKFLPSREKKTPVLHPAADHCAGWAIAAHFIRSLYYLFCWFCWTFGVLLESVKDMNFCWSLIGALKSLFENKVFVSISFQITNIYRNITNTQWYLNKGRPTWWHFLYYVNLLLNMFQMLIYPSSGACDYLVRYCVGCNDRGLCVNLFI